MKIIGAADTLDIGTRAARLTGLQQYSHMANSLNGIDGSIGNAAEFLTTAFEGMGDTVSRTDDTDQIILRQFPLRIIRGLEGDEREILLACWIELWRGVLQSHREFMRLRCEDQGNELIWYLSEEPQSK